MWPHLSPQTVEAMKAAFTTSAQPPSFAPVEPPPEFALAAPMPAAPVSLGLPDPSYQEAGLRQAMRQGFGGLSGPPIPAEYQQRIDSIRSMVDPGPLAQRYTNELRAAFAAPPAKGLKARLVGLGKNLLMGQGLPGAIRGVADPTQANLMWNLQGIAPMQAGAQAEQGFQNAALARADKIADISGVDPTTGLRTPMSMYRDEMADIARQRAQTGQQRADTYDLNVTSQIENRRRQWAKTTTDQMVRLYNAGALNGSPEALQELAERIGIPNPEKIEPRFLPGTIKTFVDENFNLNTLNTQTGKTASTGVVTSEKTKEEGREKRANIMAGQRQQSLGLQEQGLKLRETESEEKREARARKQAESEIPFPQFATEEEKQETVRKREERAQQIMREKRNTTSRGGGGAQLQQGESVVSRKRNKRTGEIIETVQRPDGSQYQRVWR